MRGMSYDKRLARAHRLALELVRLGADDELVAECLGIEPDAVAPLVKVAAAKAAAAGITIDLRGVGLTEIQPGVVEGADLNNKETT